MTTFFLFPLQLLLLRLVLPLFLSRNFYMILISIIIFSVISKDTSSKVTSFPWIQERRKTHSVQINPGNSQRERHWIRARWERKWKKGGKLFYLLLKTRTLLSQIKPKGKHWQVTNSEHVFPKIICKKRQVIVKVREAVSDGQACCWVCSLGYMP